MRIPYASFGATSYIHDDVVPAQCVWDFTDWGEYFSFYVELKYEPVYEAILDGFAKSLHGSHAGLACARLALFELSVRVTNKRDLSSAHSQNLSRK